ncbi:MAG: sugar ABC transporter permease [Eubacteriales bacterium]|nr:sugar ABC transporter permease [Eubacteriales bacterium]
MAGIAVKGRGKQKIKPRDLAVTIAFLAPAILICIVFIIYPVLDTVELSFNKWNGMYGVPEEFVGLENYQKILSDKLFWNAMLNSVYFMIGGFLVLMPLAFGLALLVTSKIRGTSFFRTCYFLPVMLGTTAVALMWTFILNPNYGLLHTIYNMTGNTSSIPDVLSTKTLNVWVVVLVNEWMYAGYNMLIFAAGLVAIPEDINEAAMLDGATGWQRIRYVTIPLMKNSFKVFSILCITGCLKVFDIIWAMTRGGPNDASSTPTIMLYSQGFSYKLFGRSSAYGVVLLVLGVGLSVLCNKVFAEDKELKA